MPVTVRGTDILFNDGSTQSTAAVASTTFGAVGSYAVLLNAVNSDLAVGGTIAGSSLRHSVNMNTSVSSAPVNLNPFDRLYRNTAGSATFSFGGTAVSGTWRKMSSGPTYLVDENGIANWGWALYVRVS